MWSKTSAYPPRTDNALRIYVDGQAAFTAISESILEANSYIYATFAYVDPDFRPEPDEQQSLLEMLKSRASHGVDVRILIWSPITRLPNTIRDPGQTPIPGVNQGRGSIQARWDQANWKGLYWFGCHHQKSFVVDGEAFVGGINSTQSYWDTPAHDPVDIRRVPYSIPRVEAASHVKDFAPLHDLFAKVTGPAAQDVEANFAERWNGATFRHELSTESVTPHGAAAAAGPLELQITRTLPTGKYPTTPGGERSIRESYLAAIAAARQFIYFENQYYYDQGIVGAIEDAAERGVRVIGLMARRPDPGQLQGYAETWREWLENQALKWRRRFTKRHVELYCPVIARPHPAQLKRFVFEDIYVHAKVLLVDDSFLTIGSANISAFSMRFHSELNVIANDPAQALALRKTLWEEHLQVPLSPEELASPAKGFHLWRESAEANLAAYTTRSRPSGRVFPWEFKLAPDTV